MVGISMALAIATAQRLAPRSGSWAAALFSTCPYVAGFWGYEWLEAAPFLFASASAFTLVRVVSGGPAFWLGATLAFSGFAAGCKASAFATLASGGFALLFARFGTRPRRERRCW